MRRPLRVERLEQRALRRLDQRVALERRHLGQLPGDVLDALEQHGQRLEVLRRAHLLQRLGEAPRPQRSDVGAGGDAHARSPRETRAARARSARAPPRTQRQGRQRPYPPLDPRMARAAFASSSSRLISRATPVSSGRSIRIRIAPCALRRSTKRIARTRGSSPGVRSSRARYRACRPARPPPRSPRPPRAARCDGGASASTPIGRYW